MNCKYIAISVVVVVQEYALIYANIQTALTYILYTLPAFQLFCCSSFLFLFSLYYAMSIIFRDCIYRCCPLSPAPQPTDDLAANGDNILSRRLGLRLGRGRGGGFTWTGADGNRDKNQLQRQRQRQLFVVVQILCKYTYIHTS